MSENTYEPAPVYWEGVARSDLAWRIAQAVSDAQRSLSAGTLETKEIRNCAANVLREQMTLDLEEGRYRLVTEWTHIPLPPDVPDIPYPSTHKMTLADEGEMEC